MTKEVGMEGKGMMMCERGRGEWGTCVKMERGEGKYLPKMEGGMLRALMSRRSGELGNRVGLSRPTNGRIKGGDGALPRWLGNEVAGRLTLIGRIAPGNRAKVCKHGANHVCGSI